MAAKTYNLDFKGYYWQDNLPEEAGIYLTYTVKFNAETREYDIDKLVYIGESDDIKGRQAQHYDDGDYPQGVTLAFSYALLLGGEDNRKRCEAALIYKVKPSWNKKGKLSFNYDATTVNSTGKHYGVPDTFTVYRTSNLS